MLSGIKPNSRLIAFTAFAVLALSGCAVNTLPHLTSTGIAAASATQAELENYVDLSIEAGDISIETLLMLLEKHFESESGRNRDLYAEYEEKRRLFYAGQLKEEPVPPRIDHTRLVASLNKVMTRFPTKPGADALVYALGYALYESGSYEESLKAFSRIVAQFPGSRFYEEAAFRLGEMYFDDGRIVEAAEAYLLLADDPHSVFYDKALYKLAWTRFRAGDYSKAFATFNTILEHGYEDSEDESAAAIAKEALLNAVDSLSHISEFNDVAPEIEKIKNAPYAPLLIMELGKLLMEQTRYVEAINVFDLYEKTFPDNLSMPLALSLSAKSTEASGNSAGTFELKERIFATFNPETSWYKMHGKDISEEVRASIAATVFDVAKNNQKDGIEKNDLNAVKKSIEAYKIFLRAFPEHALAKEASISLSEQMFYSENYADAAKRYEDIMIRWKGTDEGERGAFSALISYELVVATGKEFDRAQVTASLERILSYYAKEYASSKRRTEFVIKAIDLYLRIESYAKAREAALLLKDKEPFLSNIKTGEAYLLEKNFPGAISSYENALKVKNDGETKEKLSTIYFMSAEASEGKGVPEESVEHYLKTFELSKRSRHGEDSLLKAARIRLASGDYASFDKIATNIKENFPFSQGTYLLLTEGAKAKEADYDPSGAAAYYNDAAVHASLAGKPADRDRLFLKTADLLKESGDYKGVRKLLATQYNGGAFSSAKDMPFEALSRLGEAELKLGDKKSALKTFSTAAAKGSGGISESRVRSALAELKLEEFTAYAIKEPVNVTLKKKESMMKELLGEYALIIKSQAAEFLPKSFYGMGLVYENYGRSLLDSPRPKGLSDEELKEYNFLLEEKTYPLEEEAVKAYSSALKASGAGKGQDFATWASLSIERLSVLRPVLYKRTFEKISASPLFAEPLPIGAK